MRIFLDTSTPVCRLTFVVGSERYDYEWQADRTLADKLIGYVRKKLAEHEMKWNDINSIGVYSGPGSFTGLRIGLTVMNTVASELDIPIVGETGDDWIEKALGRLEKGENERLVMPQYGRDANITKPRK